ncbi:MAG: YceI family protein [Acidobacteriota bacterium]|nr:YceI family protein [Acidobacteriota bacterium]
MPSIENARPQIKPDVAFAQNRKRESIEDTPVRTFSRPCRGSCLCHTLPGVRCASPPANYLLPLRGNITSSPKSPPASAPKPPKSNYPITIAGTATLVGKWTCGGNADVHAKPNLSLDPIPRIGYGVQTVVVTTSVAEIECGDSGMNEHLRNSLKEKDFAEIRYRALKYVLVDNGAAVQTSGELTIAGVTKPVGLGAKLVPLPDGGTRVTGKVRINMRDYGVKPPSKLFGALKVANKVTIEFNTVVRFSPDFNLQLFSN